MEKLKEFESGLKKIGGNITLACTPGYDYYFEEFMQNIWRINIFLYLEDFSLEKIKKIRSLIGDTYKDYNLIFSTIRQRAVECWEGKLSSEKNLLVNIVFISDSSIKELWDVSRIFNRKVISGSDFTSDFINRPYSFYDFLDMVDWSNAFINYSFFKEDMPEEFRIGMLKSSFLQLVCGAVYSKGRIPSNKNKIEDFILEKLKNKKMIKILDNFYINKYKSIDIATKDVIYFVEELEKWPGFSLLH